MGFTSFVKSVVSKSFGRTLTGSFSTSNRSSRNSFLKTPDHKGGPQWSGRRPKWPWDINTQSDQYPNLTVWYPMADPSNPSTLVDLISPSRNNATLAAGEQAVASDPTFNSVESFDGATYFSTTQLGANCDVSLTFAVPFTVAGWVFQPSGGPTTQPWITKGLSSGWVLDISQRPSKIIFAMNDAALNFMTVKAVPVFDTWMHVAMTWDGVAPRMYVNGVDSSTDQLLTGRVAPDYTSGAITLGFLNNSVPLTGKLTDFRVYEGRALTVNQVAELYDSATRFQLIRGRGNG
jgi:hypothetical protein